jgi:LacI family transcriptional regulator
MPRMIVEKAVTGMLLVGTADPLILNAFAQHVPKIVLVDNRDATGKYESVVSDGFGGAFAATKFLLELGHRRIAFFLSEPEVSTFRDRLHGYQCALMEAGIPLDPSLLVAEPTLFESEKRLAALICSGEKPTALLAANDFHAFHALRICRSLGQCVPQDISLMGFDDSTFSTHTDPALTTSRVETEYMGRLAVRRLVAQMNAEGNITSAAPPVCNVVPVSLVVRQSCRAL